MQGVCGLAESNEELVVVFGVSATGLGSCLLPHAQFDLTDVLLGPLHMRVLAAEIHRLLVGHGVAGSVASRLLLDRRILTCLHTTAGVPGYAVLLWEAMLGQFQQPSTDQPLDRPACGMCCYASGDFHTEQMAHLH